MGTNQVLGRCSKIRGTQRTLIHDRTMHREKKKKNAAQKTEIVGKCAPEGMYDMRISKSSKNRIFTKKWQRLMSGRDVS